MASSEPLLLKPRAAAVEAPLPPPTPAAPPQAGDVSALRPAPAYSAPQLRVIETDHSVSHDWDSPAYERLREHNLLCSQWRKASIKEMQLWEGNASPAANLLRYALSYAVPPLFCCLKTAEVPAGSVRKLQDGRGGFHFLGNRGQWQGVHAYWDCFYRIGGKDEAINSSTDTSGVVITNGDCCVVVVPQGFIGMAQDMGQPVLLPPGMHQWRSATMKFQRNIDLNQPIIRMGPYTLLTVDKGYEAVTQNNGQQQVLPGGQVHLLNHRNWKFEKFISRKIQTDDLKRIEVLTGDNVLMHVDATVCWSIENAQKCAERAAETMPDGQPGTTGAHTISKLRNDVLKQAEASLSALVGKTTFSAAFSAATALQVGQVPLLQPSTAGSASGVAPGVPVERDTAALLFDIDKLSCAISHANEMTTRYGVEVLSINIISAKPADNALMTCLAQGAVAAAEAQQLETIARGRAKAATINAKGEADALKISAEAQASTAVTRAEGNKAAAALLNEEEVAVRLATIEATGDALKKSRSSLILGQHAGSLSGMLLANPHVTSGMLGEVDHAAS